MHTRTRTRGFTLIELIATLAVAATIGAIAVPALSSIHASYRGASTASELTTALAYARMAAVASNEPVTVCPSADGSRCSGRSDWSTGWIAYADATRSDQPATGDAVLLRNEIPPGRARLKSSSGRRYVRFQPSGWASGTNLTINICLETKAWGRVVLNNAGRARVERGAAACRQA